ncbi:benzoate-CoA ligase family protein [Amycolatopsis magusensis]|uniref:benzoate-CoA ligase family protein n=1 Tax=Amycolatopsis magusensis TaxID=882444 RepID=UPI003C2C8325
MPAPATFNATDYLLDRNLAQGRGDRTAVVSTSRTLTYAELAAEVHRVAGALRGLGVRPEERVMMCLGDDLELFVSILATMHLGAIAVPTSTMLTEPELRDLVVDSRARVMLTAPAFAETAGRAARNAPDIQHVVEDWDAFTGEPVERSYPTWADSPALWLYTSGTTGRPKAAMHRHADIRTVAENYGQQVLGIGPGDRCLSVAKLFFAYGIGNSMFFPMSVGATAILDERRPNPALFAERVREEGVTLFFGTPSFWAPLLASDVPDDAFSTVRQGVSAGEALPPRLYHGVLDRFGVEVLDGIGSTEMLHIFVSNRPGQVRPGSSGTVVPGYEVEIRDATGTVIDDAGVVGELYVRGDSAAIGYWCRAETTRQVFLGEWMQTGDTYVRNSDGTLSCLGRFDDMLKAGGIWVSPAEVEDRLLQHPDVAEAVVVAAPDADALDKPVAVVVPVPGRAVDGDELIQWCRGTLAAFKRPRAVVEVPELPKTATGKIRRNVLRDMVSTTLLREPVDAPAG